MKTTLHPCDLDLGVPGRSLQRARGDVVGRRGEELAAEHLTGMHGCEVLARNWRSGDRRRPGELDLVVADQRENTLIVVEVKTRRDAQRFGGALVAVSPRQRSRVRSLTGCYLAASHRRFRQVRLDLVAIDVGNRIRLQHLRGAL